jgi:hypothetical protein
MYVCVNTSGQPVSAAWRGPNKALRAKWPRPASVPSSIITVMTVARCYYDATPLSN